MCGWRSRRRAPADGRSCSCTASPAPRRTSPTSSTPWPSAAGTRWHPTCAGTAPATIPRTRRATRSRSSAADLRALADALGWERFVLLGHSMGGMIAQHLLLADPGRLRGLVLMDTTHGAVDWVDADALALGASIVRERGHASADGGAERACATRTRSSRRPSCACSTSGPATPSSATPSCSRRAPAMWLAMAPALLTQPDRLDRLADVDVPALVIVGEQDTPFVAHGERMAKTIPGARLAIIPDAGHSPQFENTDAWWAALGAFLERRGVTARSRAGTRRAWRPARHRRRSARSACARSSRSRAATSSPIYDGVREGRHPHRRRPPRADRDVRGRGLRQAHPPPGVAVLTAGPGVTNGVSAITTAHFNGSPLVVLGGRAPQARWGAGSLQEFDHVPVVASITKAAAHGDRDRSDRQGAARGGHARAHAAPRPGVPRLPARRRVRERRRRRARRGDAAGARARPRRRRAAPPRSSPAPSGPVLVAGGDVWADGAWEALRRCVEALRVPTFVNGQGRGCLPADHELAFAAHAELPQAGRRGRRGGHAARLPAVVRLVRRRRRWCTSSTTPTAAPAMSTPAVSPAGDLSTILDGMAAHTGARADHEAWIAKLRDEETARREAERAELEADTDPIHPARVYGELRKRLARDAVVIGDGGDFVSYAGKLRRLVRARLLDRPGALRLPRHRAGLRDRRARRASRPPGRAAAGRRGHRLQRHGLRHAGAPRAAGGRRSSATTASGASRSTRCRRSTATTSPPTSSPAAATTEVVEGLGGAGETVERPGRPRPRARPRLRRGRALPRQRPHRPRGRLPPLVEPRLIPA